MTQNKKPAATSKVNRSKKKQPLAVGNDPQQPQGESKPMELAQSRAELEAAYRQYTDLYDFAPVGYFTLARNGAIHEVNLAGANLLGVDHNEATRLRLAAFISKDSYPTFNVFFEKLLSGEGKESCELAFEKRGHELTWARLEATCFEGGDISRAMLTDITGRKRMEQVLLESENRFRTLLEDVSTIAVQGCALDGTTQYWNTASEKLYGYSAQEAIGQSLPELIIPPEMRKDAWQAIHQMGETGEPIPAAELSLMRKDGSRVAVYSSHAIVSVPGRAPELFCLDVDLTERKRIASLLLARVRISEFAELHTFDELLQKMLDEAETITGSQVGFAHFLEADQKTLQLQMWSTNTLKNFCTAESKGSHSSIDEAGVWAACVSRRAPLIHNDYANLPNHKELPQGHTPVIRELVVPVLRNDLIVMIVGVGNKSADYDENDIETLSQLANLAWDIVQRKQAEEQLQKSEKRFRNLVETTNDWIWEVDVNGVYTYVSPRIRDILGFEPSEIIGKTPFDLMPPKEAQRVLGIFAPIAAAHSQFLNLENKNIRKDGRVVIMETSGAPIVEDGIFCGYCGVDRDITMRKQAEVELQYIKDELEKANRELRAALAHEQQLAHTDALTGINNRRHLFELAEHEFEIAARYQQPLAVVMFDIDHFKDVNDTFGHAVGDKILQQITQVACAELRSSDVIGRYGGEEFVIILPVTNAQRAYSLAERIRVGVMAIRAPTEKGDASVTLSIGIVELHHGAQAGSIENMIRDADKVMYTAKQAGRNQTKIGVY